MNVHELTRLQMAELKADYLDRLAEQGAFSEVMDVDYDYPTDEDFANASELVPDDVIFREYEYTEFEPEYFFNT